MTDSFSPTLVAAATKLFAPGESFGTGCAESLSMYEEMETLGHRLPRKPVRSVKSWTWVDIETTPEDLMGLELSGLHPAFIFARILIADTSRTKLLGFWLMTSLMIAGTHHENSVETHDARYLLVGPGNRVSLSTSEAAAILNSNGDFLLAWGASRASCRQG